MCRDTQAERRLRLDLYREGRWSFLAAAVGTTCQQCWAPPRGSANIPVVPDGGPLEEQEISVLWWLYGHARSGPGRRGSDRTADRSGRD
jgi:hypothetical protein